ncbi:sec-independent protein translocase protein TATB, chloroplastic-like isoform X2 [Olea europaea var. sylvestris]|uniref:Sec-independent translocase TATB, chloroplastic isoform X1 n=1 Tax=Olea europaea subsp. europaea TaxID=158383 RepID=A0A8S0V0B7_OLEEU|nr:sec-independent protein translocase protein TATB, chloroplastic-like isoform X2 [Olea europaea var. sylvestris]CAA3024962.1 sec-independent translocase TATB, chloroplastic isoform X1 [Olea europaea subsp. europaea]
MASAIFTPNSYLSSLSAKPSICAFSNSAIIVPKNVSFQYLKCIRQPSVGPFSPWNGLKNMGISISQRSIKIERKGKCTGKGAYASLFGVGAPEALVIGVVALLVFGPKGLAEVARNLGKTLRAFQPTIRELQEVSREFKGTLEREIGLDEIENPVKKSPSSNAKSEGSELNVDPNGSPPETEDPLAVQLRNTLAQLQKEQSEAESQDTAPEVASKVPPTENPGHNAVEEATSAVEPPPEPENIAVQEVASEVAQPVKPESDELQEVSSSVALPVKHESNELQEVASAVPSPPKPENKT